MSLPNGHVLDSSLSLKAAGLVAASAAGSIINVGAFPIRADVVVDVTALEIASNDESYWIVIQGSPDSDFGTAGNIVELGAIHLGAKEIKLTDSDADDATGQFVFPVSNERNGTVYPYMRSYTVVAGTIATGINYSARLALAVAN